MSNPLDSTAPNLANNKGKPLSKKKMALVLVFAVCTVIGVMAAYSSSLRKSAQMAANQNIQYKQSKVSNNAKSSAALERNGKEHRKPSTSPTILSVNADQLKDKQEAQILGVSHIDNTDVLSEKTEVKVDTSAASDQPTEPKVINVTPKTKSQTKAQQNTTPQPPPRSQVVRENLQALFKSPLEVNYPSAVVNTTSYVQAFKVSAANRGVEVNVIPKSNMAKMNPYVTTVKQDLEAAKAQKSLQEQNQTNANDNEDVAPNDDPDMVRILDMGDKLTGLIVDAINSDYQLDVFIDLYDAPLNGARLRAQFQLTEQQDGILLKVNQLQFHDHIISVNGYAVDVTIDSSPLFDNEVDTHFVQRFLARASAAFIVPWIDFISATTTTINGDSVIIDNPSVDSTKDRIIGSIASVAKEFIPDLRKNANIPATVSVPKNYPVGVVFADALYVPKGLLDSDPTTNPNKHYKAVLNNEN